MKKEAVVQSLSAGEQAEVKALVQQCYKYHNTQVAAALLAKLALQEIAEEAVSLCGADELWDIHNLCREVGSTAHKLAKQAATVGNLFEDDKKASGTELVKPQP